MQQSRKSSRTQSAMRAQRGGSTSLLRGTKLKLRAPAREWGSSIYKMPYFVGVATLQQMCTHAFRGMLYTLLKTLDPMHCRNLYVSVAYHATWQSTSSMKRLAFFRSYIRSTSILWSIALVVPRRLTGDGWEVQLILPSHYLRDC